MLVIQDPFKQTDLPVGGVATIGNFDGLHVGHQEIIRGVVSKAKEIDAPSVVITFQPHPLAVVAPDRLPSQILTLAQKEELIADLGADALIVIPFTQEFSRWRADTFARSFLHEKLRIREVRIGEDFCFGAGREGGLEFLQKRGAELGFKAEGVKDIVRHGIRVSSSIVRRAVSRGRMRVTNLALGRTYFIDGAVATGRRLGRRIGVPTVNLEPENELFPDNGVYVTTCRLESFARNFECVTNIGVRPTLYENYATTIESHLLDFDANVYGDGIRLYFHKLLRREKQFRSAIELTSQIQKDIQDTREYFLKNPVESKAAPGAPGGRP